MAPSFDDSKVEQAEQVHKLSSKYDAIPGPLGLESASLKGKVALVTGAGTPLLAAVATL